MFEGNVYPANDVTAKDDANGHTHTLELLEQSEKALENMFWPLTGPWTTTKWLGS